jgi:nitrite reductase/ring-hydroxylating ferredoxin subunit
VLFLGAEANVEFLKRSFFQRLFGQCATSEPQDGGCWSHAGERIDVDLSRAPELAAPGGAIRLEGRGLRQRVLVAHCDDGEYRAWHNKCTHAGRRLDPVPGTATVQCCSVNKSTFSHQGQVLHGPAKSAIPQFRVSRDNSKLVISLD